MLAPRSVLELLFDDLAGVILKSAFFVETLVADFPNLLTCFILIVEVVLIDGTKCRLEWNSVFGFSILDNLQASICLLPSLVNFAVVDEFATIVVPCAVLQLLIEINLNAYFDICCHNFVAVFMVLPPTLIGLF